MSAVKALLWGFGLLRGDVGFSESSRRLFWDAISAAAVRVVEVYVGNVVSFGDVGAGEPNKTAPAELGEFSRDRLRFLGLVGLRKLPLSATRGSSIVVVRALGVVGRAVCGSEALVDTSEVEVMLVVSAMKMSLYSLFRDAKKVLRSKCRGYERVHTSVAVEKSNS